MRRRPRSTLRSFDPGQKARLIYWFPSFLPSACSMRTSYTTKRRSSSTMRAFIALTAAMQTVAMHVEAAHVTFKNQCEYPIQVYDNHGVCPLRGARKESPVYGCDRDIPGSIMYRHGTDPQATLAEFAYGSGKAWYDISIIPPGPGDCTSLENCHSVTGKVGFNVPVMILPTKYWEKSEYPRCQRLLCHYDGCPDAFHYPNDTQKVYNCPDDERFEVIYCP